MIPCLWAKGKFEEVFEYVIQDVRITLVLAKTCDSRGYLRWVTCHGTGRMMPLPDGWRTVEVAQNLPEPSSCWLNKQWSRANFTAWMQSVADRVVVNPDRRNDTGSTSGPHAAAASLSFTGFFFIMWTCLLPAIHSIPVKPDRLTSQLATYCT